MFLNCFFEIIIKNIPDFYNNKKTGDIYQNFLDIIKESEGKVAVSFPKWNEKNMGNSIRFFANEENSSLLKFMQDLSWLNEIKSKYLVDVSDINLVPENVNIFHRFFRSHNREKQSLGYFKRLERRYAKRHGEKGDYNYEELIQKRIEKNSNKIFHKILTNNGDSLLLERELVENFNSQEEVKFSSYGFAPKNFGVPHF